MTAADQGLDTALAKSPVSADELHSIFNRLERHVETRYGIPVQIEDVPSPFTGDLDGAAIQIDYEEDIAGAIFLLVHLFGHTVQWNLSADARELGSRLALNPPDALMRRLLAYEGEAARYSLAVLHEIGVHTLDQWLSDFSACDLAYLAYFYSTGEKLPFFGFWQDGAPAIEALKVPAFRPERWVFRGEGIVI